MEYHEWLKQLKVGDEVIYHAWGFGEYYNLAKVSRITPSGLIRVNGVHFRPDDGYARSGGACIEDPDNQESAQRLKEYNNHVFVYKTMQKLRATNAENVTYDQAVEIAKIMGWEV